MDIIEKHPEKPWEWADISWNPNLTMEFIEKHPEEDWNWNLISVNPNITMDIIEKHPEKPWELEFVSQNPNITMEFIKKHVGQICFRELSGNVFTFENNRFKKKDAFVLLEKVRSFHKLQNVYVINQYM